MGKRLWISLSVMFTSLAGVTEVRAACAHEALLDGQGNPIYDHFDAKGRPLDPPVMRTECKTIVGDTNDSKLDDPDYIAWEKARPKCVWEGRRGHRRLRCPTQAELEAWMAQSPLNLPTSQDAGSSSGSDPVPPGGVPSGQQSTGDGVALGGSGNGGVAITPTAPVDADGNPIVAPTSQQGANTTYDFQPPPARRTFIR